MKNIPIDRKISSKKWGVKKNTCALCGKDKDLTPFKGNFICSSCLYLIKESNQQLFG